MHRETLAVVDGILGVEAEAHGPPVSTAGRMDLRGSNGTIAPREQLAEALGELARVEV